MSASCTVPCAPGATSPADQVTVPAESTPPFDAPANSTPAGSTSLITVLRAVAVPTFWYVITYGTAAMTGVVAAALIAPLTLTVLPLMPVIVTTLPATDT